MTGGSREEPVPRRAARWRRSGKWILVSVGVLAGLLVTGVVAIAIAVVAASRSGSHGGQGGTAAAPKVDVCWWGGVGMRLYDYCTGDIGAEPISGRVNTKTPTDLSNPELQCATDMRGLANKRVVIEDFYDGRLYGHGSLRSPGDEEIAHISFDRPGLVKSLHASAAKDAMPAGHYRCLFRANGRLLASRTFAVR